MYDEVAAWSLKVMTNARALRQEAVEGVIVHAVALPFSHRRGSEGIDQTTALSLPMSAHTRLTSAEEGQKNLNEVDACRA